MAPVDALDGKSVGEALLTPTRIYVKQVLSVLAECPKAVRALAHITGGGITENLNRALNSQVNTQVDLGTWPVPAIVKYVCEAANLSEGQALKTFNMGVGMVLIVDPDRADEVEAALAKAGETTYCVGRIVAGAGEVGTRARETCTVTKGNSLACLLMGGRPAAGRAEALHVPMFGTRSGACGTCSQLSRSHP